MLKRYHSDSLDDDELEASPVPVKRRSVDLPLQEQWRTAVQLRHQISAATTMQAPMMVPPVAPAPVPASPAPTVALTAEDWCVVATEE